MPTRAITRGFNSAKSMDETSTMSGFRSEEHTSELQSLRQLVCRLLLVKKTIGCGFGFMGSDLTSWYGEPIGNRFLDEIFFFLTVEEPTLQSTFPLEHSFPT